jgi:hypothetical protein
MAIDNPDNVEEIVENWNHPIDPYEESNLYKLLTVIVSENERLDIELDEIYDNRFLDTATGSELEKIAELVGVVRKTDEVDAKLRKRIRGAFAANASDTTYDSFTSAALSILDASPNQVTFITPPDSPPKTVEIQLDGSVIEENPLSSNELIILLNGALSVDAKTEITQTGTFAFYNDEDDGLKGFDEGTWSVGVNQ